MKVAYVFRSDMASTFQLASMILPQLEEGFHGAEVVGMFFFDDNTYVLRKGDPIGERLGKVAKKTGLLLMLCDRCALERGLAARARLDPGSDAARRVPTAPPGAWSAWVPGPRSRVPTAAPSDRSPR